MCGIAGIYAPRRSQIYAQSTAASMVSTLVHRGPDAEGIWLSDELPLALGHRRLSIQDLSPLGAQPMHSQSGKYTITYNGEIYNFKEIRQVLEGLGHSFRGGSDTEVLIAAIEEWSLPSAIERMHGMFAFALFDHESKTLTLCRDRMGEKPIYYGWVDDCFVFSSELKAIACVFKNHLEIDREAQSAYMRFGYVPGPHSVYRGIKKLVPGHYAVLDLDRNHIDKGAPHLNSYWDLHKVATSGLETPYDNPIPAVDDFDQLLQKVVSRQCIADVPVGAFLSGGIDSSLVAAVMQSVNNTPINTYTIGFQEKEFDEAPFARDIAQTIGSRHHELYVSAKDCLSLVSSIPNYWDEPFSDSSQVAALLVAKKAREHVAVCLSGDGGDELFCGYNRYATTSKIWPRINRLPNGLRQLAAESVRSINQDTWNKLYRNAMWILRQNRTQANVGVKIHKFAEILKQSNLVDAYLFLLSFWPKPTEVILGAPEATNPIIDLPNPGTGDFIHDAMYWDQIGYLPDDNLVKGDRSTMAVSMEARLPLLDHEIVEFSWRLPTHMKLHQGKTKWLLREVLNRYVPPSLFERPKMGFSVPIASWLRHELRPWAEELLQPHLLDASGINNDPVQASWRNHIQGRADNANQLWTVLMWQAWQHSRG